MAFVTRNGAQTHPDYSWLLALVPELANHPILDKFRDMQIQQNSLVRMNVNHFTRLGLDEQLAIKLHDRFIQVKYSSSKPCIASLATQSSLTISIIGSAGRGDDKWKMTKDLFGQMVAHCETIINQLCVTKKMVHLVSGGAAWSGNIYCSC